MLTFKFNGYQETIPFGKHRGATVDELPLDYIEWLLNSADHGWVDENRDVLRDRLVNLDEAKIPELDLKDDQVVASDYVTETLFDEGEPLARIQGAAGYGKSYTCQDIVIKAKREGYMVNACATSYVATQNLSKDLDLLNVPCATIARTLALDVEYEGTTERYVPGVRTAKALPKILGEGHLLIVDEYSMVDDNTAQLLIDSANQYGGRLLVVGDAYQLPSPAQDWDSLLTAVENATELTIPKRYTAGTPLHLVEQIARHRPYEFDARQFSGSGAVEQVMSLDALYDRYVESYHENQDDQHLMLWYRRADMVSANRALRDRLYGRDSQAIQPGESLRVQRTSDYTEYYAGDGSRVYSGTTFKVSEVHEVNRVVRIDEFNLSFEIPCYYVDTDKGERFAVVFSVNENKAESGTLGAVEFNEALRVLSERCSEVNSFKAYRQFRNCFVQVSYSYASTVHRVQGQSVDRVFTCPEALRRADPFTAAKLQYVGLTRAKKQLVCL